MATKITQERKETLLKVKEEINQLNSYIDDILEGKMHISEAAEKLGICNGCFRDSMDKGLDRILRSKKIKIFDDETCFDILRSRQQPVERLYQDVLCLSDDKILFIIQIIQTQAEYTTQQFNELCSTKHPDEFLDKLNQFKNKQYYVH